MKKRQFILDENYLFRLSMLKIYVIKVVQVAKELEAKCKKWAGARGRVSISVICVQMPFQSAAVFAKLTVAINFVGCNYRFDGPIQSLFMYTTRALELKHICKWLYTIWCFNCWPSFFYRHQQTIEWKE